MHGAAIGSQRPSVAGSMASAGQPVSATWTAARISSTRISPSWSMSPATQPDSGAASSAMLTIVEQLVDRDRAIAAAVAGTDDLCPRRRRRREQNPADKQNPDPPA